MEQLKENLAAADEQMSRLLSERYFGDSEAELKILCLAALLCSDAP